jgi:hypothetical protein
MLSMSLIRNKIRLDALHKHIGGHGGAASAAALSCSVSDPRSLPSNKSSVRSKITLKSRIQKCDQSINIAKNCNTIETQNIKAAKKHVGPVGGPNNNTQNQ